MRDLNALKHSALIENKFKDGSTQRISTFISKAK